MRTVRWMRPVSGSPVRPRPKFPEARALVLTGLVLILAVAAGCSTMRIETDWDTTADFSGLHTYAWLPEPDRSAEPPRVDNTLLARRVHRAVDAELAQRGIAKVDAKDADFLVTYHAAQDSKLDVQTVNTGFGYTVGTWGWGFGTETYVRSYDEGTLILDIVDPKTHQLEWRGWAIAEVRPSATPEEREARINEAVHRMLARFPPKQKEKAATTTSGTTSKEPPS
jgi:hypothetical protein